MPSKTVRPIISALMILVIAALACNVPGGSGAQPAAPQALPSPTPTPALPGEPGTPAPFVPTVSPINHVLTPPDQPAAGSYNYDVPSDGTASEHRAPYGDLYRNNLFERPFTKSVMDYLPELDIVTFRLTADADWYYVSVEMTGGDMNSQIGANYGIELDVDHDGFGDYLIWTHPLFTTTWTTDIVQVYKDTNHDTGGVSAERSDAVFDGDGYDTVIFDQGVGADTDLAWVRLDPHIASAIQFAFKRSLAGGAFMWGAWADAGLKDPSQFNYNDRFKEPDAGSPEKSEAYYPIQAIAQVDDTCWAAVGFKPTGFEPHLCPPPDITPTHQPKDAPTPFIILINFCVLFPDLCAPPPPIIK
ncbi:MAG TPA: hypothetical protein VGJ22_05355 [Anaerolineales bacterium]|jgi:hypothetical protein